MDFCYNLPVGVIGLAEYVVLSPFLVLTAEDPDYIPEDVE
jgi:hypothetical protein